MAELSYHSYVLPLRISLRILEELEELTQGSDWVNWKVPISVCPRLCSGGSFGSVRMI